MQNVVTFYPMPKLVDTVQLSHQTLIRCKLIISDALVYNDINN